LTYAAADPERLLLPKEDLQKVAEGGRVNNDLEVRPRNEEGLIEDRQLLR
jgi:hypothetical protein